MLSTLSTGILSLNEKTKSALHRAVKEFLTPKKEEASGPLVRMNLPYGKQTVIFYLSCKHARLFSFKALFMIKKHDKIALKLAHTHTWCPCPRSAMDVTPPSNLTELI